MNTIKNITRYIIAIVFFLLFIIGFKNTFFGKYNVVNHIRTKKQLENLNITQKNKIQKKERLIHKTKQLKSKNNLTTHITKKINIINKDHFIIHY